MLEQIRGMLAEKNLDALFVTNKTNIFYLTGFKGSNGSVLVTKNHLYLLTDARYLEKAKKNVVQSCRVIDIAQGLFNQLHILLAKHKVKSFGIEARDLSYAFFLKLDSLNGFQIAPADEVISTVRSVKTKQELRALRHAQKMNAQAMKLFVSGLKHGMTEKEAVWKLRIIAHDLGADDLAFDPIIAFGAHSAMPHHECSSQKKLKKGDVVLIDMGLRCAEYCSDMTRTFFTKKPTSEQAHMYQTVLEAQKKAVTEVKAGVESDLIDKAARVHIHQAGFIKKFGHATGHGVGLDVHEFPSLSKGSTAVLQEGMVLAIEPGIYLEGKLGIRIEDMVEVKANGRQMMAKFATEMQDVQIKV